MKASTDKKSKKKPSARYKGLTPRQTRGHIRFWKVLKVLSRPISPLFFGIRKRDELSLPEEACLVLANHTCYFDPVIVGMLLRQPIYFVTAENLLRHRFAAMIALGVFHSIPCAKGKQNAVTVLDIGRHIRAGHNVVMFPEGNITYDGVSADAIPSTGKLVKLLKCPVVTLRVEGAYLVMPRWSHHYCRQKVRGTVMGVYRPEDLSELTPDQVLEQINRDLYLEQPAAQGEIVQKKVHRSVKGLKYLLYACPNCGKLGEISEHGREIRCSCGSAWRMNEYGRLDGEKVHTLYEWNRWQQGHLARVVGDGSPISVSVPNTRLFRIAQSSHQRTLVDSGELRMTREYLQCGSSRYPLDTVARMDTRNQGVLLFSLVSGDYFEVHSHGGYPGILFKTIFQILEEGEGAQGGEAPAPEHPNPETQG